MILMILTMLCIVCIIEKRKNRRRSENESYIPVFGERLNKFSIQKLPSSIPKKRMKGSNRIDTKSLHRSKSASSLCEKLCCICMDKNVSQRIFF